MHENTNIMRISLDIKKPSEFFWLRKIRAVNIQQCCAKCFIGQSDVRMFHGTKHGQTPRFIELDIEALKKYVAYYLCGLSRHYNYAKNTHLAFIHAPFEAVFADSDQIEARITNARRIDFEGYTPDPPGEYTEYQRACRNWIFANFLQDGMLWK